MIHCREEVLKITKDLLEIPSVVNTSGEAMIAQHIYAFLSATEYYRRHPEYLVKQRTINDKNERYNVLALLRGRNGNSNKTVIMMGHMDTVGIENYAQDDLPPNVKRDMDSGEWLFGRGSLDMKSGIASHLYLMKHYSERLEQLEGNLLFVAACDEEDSSHGIISALSQLQDFQRKFNLDYTCVINSDLVLPRFGGDVNRYIYRGTVGKLLPTFYVSGIETHPGDAHNSFDSNLIAAEIIREIDYNPDFIDRDLGEATLPPVSLKFNDLKEGYSINIPNETLLYFNMFTHKWSPKDVLHKFKNAAQTAMNRALELQRERIDQYIAMSGILGERAAFNAEILTYDELSAQLISLHGARFEAHMENYKRKLKQKELDTRSYSLFVVREMSKWKEKKNPFIVLFYSSLYYSRVHYSGTTEKEAALDQALLRAIDDIQSGYPYPIKVRDFYPYISDMSFVSLSDDDQGIQAFCSNFPCWENTMFVDYEGIRQLNLPVINVGPYGHDPHLKFERAEIEYTTEIVPNLINGIITNLLVSSD